MIHATAGAASSSVKDDPVVVRRAGQDVKQRADTRSIRVHIIDGDRSGRAALALLAATLNASSGDRSAGEPLRDRVIAARATPSIDALQRLGVPIDATFARGGGVRRSMAIGLARAIDGLAEPKLKRSVAVWSPDLLSPARAAAARAQSRVIAAELATLTPAGLDFAPPSALRERIRAEWELDDSTAAIAALGPDEHRPALGLIAHAVGVVNFAGRRVAFIAPAAARTIGRGVRITLDWGGRWPMIADDGPLSHTLVGADVCVWRASDDRPGMLRSGDATDAALQRRFAELAIARAMGVPCIACVDDALEAEHARALGATVLPYADRLGLARAIRQLVDARR